MNKYKKPNLLVYGVFRLISKIASKFVFNLKVNRNESKKVKGSYVIICNHEASIDFIALAATQRRRINFVISNSFYQSLKVNPFLKACGVIPKQQFQTSINDLKRMKQVVDNDMPLAIYPAGMMTENGLSTPIPSSTGKFVKWMEQDVYIAKIKGTYLTNPKWSSKRRKGKIELDIYKLYDKEELKNLKADDIYKTVSEHLDFNSYLDQEERRVIYKHGNNIVGLENVLYKCPKCHKEFTMTSSGIDHLVCKECGNDVHSDKYGFLEKTNDDSVCYKYSSDWYNEIENELFEEIKSNPHFELSQNAKISMIDYDKHAFVNVGEAKVVLNSKEIVFDGVIKSERFNEVFSIKSFPILPFSPGKYLEFQNGHDIYRIYLEKGQEVMKWIIAIKCFYKLNNK